MFQCACLWLQNPIRQSCFEQQRHHRCLFWGDHLSVPSTLLLLLPGSSQSAPYCSTVPFLPPKIWPADMMLWNLSKKKKQIQMLVSDARLPDWSRANVSLHGFSSIKGMPPRF
jgi:hypothetical protein